MATMNVSLPNPMKDWVEAKIEDGKYSSESDYVRDLIRLDQQYHDNLEALRLALIEGERNGTSTPIIDEIWAQVKARRGLDVGAFRTGAQRRRRYPRPYGRRAWS